MWAIINEGKIERQEGALPSFKKIQELVGGYVEAAWRWHLPSGNTVVLFCNEEGKLLNLPPNFFLIELQDWIVGRCVLIGENSKGDIVHLSQDDLSHFTMAGSFVLGPHPFMKYNAQSK